MKSQVLSNSQEQILKELKQSAKQLKHTPRLREIAKLARRCQREFGYFNKAKKLAGLEVVNVRVTDFPKKAFALDKDLAFIAAFLTADGHI
ncbi:MAG: homing endonuclease associated repeat-containing protein [Nanoarchaeota archaeon]